MKAVKENKVHKITEAQKASYLAQGYTITDDKGKVIEVSPKTTVKYSEYEAVVEENKKLKAAAKKS